MELYSELHLYRYTDVIFPLNKNIRSLSHYFTVLMIVSFCLWFRINFSTNFLISYINKGNYIYDILFGVEFSLSIIQRSTAMLAVSTALLKAQTSFVVKY